MIEDERLAAVKRQYACFFSGDINGFYAGFHPDIVMWEAPSLPYGGIHSGMNAFLAAMDIFLATWEDIALDIDEYLVGDKTVMATGTFKATSRKTKKRVEVSLCEAWQVRDGKIIYLKPVYADTAAICAAIG